MDNGDLVAVVANCGDSRLLTDDGTNNFRAVTLDHRPEDPLERKRLEACVERHEASLETQPNSDALRIYPGGLAVSRTVGDVGLSEAAVPTPDVYRITLSEHLHPSESRDDSCESKDRTIRFLLASDGLWDVMNNQDVGSLAARRGPDGKYTSPTKAVEAVLSECLHRTGGHHDDTTVLVVDVKIPSA